MSTQNFKMCIFNSIPVEILSPPFTVVDESSEMPLDFETGLNWLLFLETNIECHSTYKALQTVILRCLSYAVGFITKIAFLIY